MGLAASARPVLLVPYDAGWPTVFDELRRVYVDALAELALAVEHVGSTAVPGLPAKPIIDIDVVIAARDDLPRVQRGLGRLGYEYRGDQGVPGRESFARNRIRDVPRDGSGRRWPEHNLYVCAQDSRELRRHLLFRDWLRAHPEAAEAYAALKRQLAEQHATDRDAYCEAKRPFVEQILAAAAQRV